MQLPGVVEVLDAGIRSSNTLSSTPAWGSILIEKENSSVRSHFENANSLPILNRVWKLSWKHKILKHLWKRFHIDIISLVETQINYHLLDSTHDANENLFRGDQHFTTMSSNSKRLIAKHQHGGVAIAAIG